MFCTCTDRMSKSKWRYLVDRMEDALTMCSFICATLIASASFVDFCFVSVCSNMSTLINDIRIVTR